MKRTATFIVLLTVILAACGDGDAGSQPPDPSGGWQLVAGTVAGQQINPITSHPVTIEFENGVVAGTSSCNSYGGEYTLEGSKVTIGEIVMTEMACFPDEVMAMESQYLGALAGVSSLAMNGENLVLSGDGVELEFEPFVGPPTAEMMGTVWVLDGIIQGDSVSSVAGERATLEFFSDGSVLASTGCRNLAGNYVETATGVKTTSMSTAGECPDNLSQQDNSVVTVLEGEYRVEIDGETMTLTAADDDGLIYRVEA